MQIQDNPDQPRHASSGRRLILKPTVRKRIPFSNATMWREIKAGRFPKPIKIGPRLNAFFEDEIDAYLAQRAAERDAKIAKVSATAARMPLGKGA